MRALRLKEKHAARSCLDIGFWRKGGEVLKSLTQETFSSSNRPILKTFFLIGIKAIVFFALSMSAIPSFAQTPYCARALRYLYERMEKKEQETTHAIAKLREDGNPKNFVSLRDQLALTERLRLKMRIQELTPKLNETQKDLSENRKKRDALKASIHELRRAIKSFRKSNASMPPGAWFQNLLSIRDPNYPNKIKSRELIAKAEWLIKLATGLKFEREKLREKEKDSLEELRAAQDNLDNFNNHIHHLTVNAQKEMLARALELEAKLPESLKEIASTWAQRLQEILLLRKAHQLVETTLSQAGSASESVRKIADTLEKTIVALNHLEQQTHTQSQHSSIESEQLSQIVGFSTITLQNEMKTAQSLINDMAEVADGFDKSLRECTLALKQEFEWKPLKKPLSKQLQELQNVMKLARYFTAPPTTINFASRALDSAKTQLLQIQESLKVMIEQMDALRTDLIKKEQSLHQLKVDEIYQGYLDQRQP